MATLKPCVKNDFVKDEGKSNIKIRLSHDGNVRYLKTPYDIEPPFLGTDDRVKQKHPNCITPNTSLIKLIDEYNDITVSVGTDIRYMDIMTLVNNLRCSDGYGTSFLNYTIKRIVDLCDEVRYSCAESYKASFKWLIVFTGTNDIMFKEINHDFLEKFQKIMKTHGKKVNTRAPENDLF